MLKYKKYKNRKAQLEIVGLLIIVILVVIVIAIIMKFKISEQPRQIKKDYMYDQMSTSFLLSFLRANTQCANSITFEEALKDCAQGKAVSCPSAANSCNYLNNTIKYILNETLDKWGMGYKFEIGHTGFNYNFKFQNIKDSELPIGITPYAISLWPQTNAIIMNLSVYS